MKRLHNRFWPMFLFAMVIWLGVLYLFFGLNLDQHLQLKTTEVQTAYNTIRRGYKELTDVTARWLIDDADTRQLLRELVETGSSSARGRLYRKWIANYKSLRAHQVRQLHFIDADGFSMLRMHAPTRSGDNLLSTRPLIRKALQTGQAQAGFENGRLYTGYRFIYPVQEGNDLIGVLEIGIPFSAIQRLLTSGSLHNSEIRFHLRRSDLIRSMVDHSSDENVIRAFIAAMYTPSVVHSEYVNENLANPLYGVESMQSAPFVDELEQSIAQNATYRHDMDQGLTFSRLLCTEFLRCYYSTFVPIHTAEISRVAYLSNYSPADKLKADLSQLVALAIMGGLLIFLTIFHLTRSQRTQRQMRALSEHINKGIYVIDSDSIISYVNPETSRILGYSEAELIGNNAHTLFHHHSAGAPTSVEDCPIRRVTSTGEVFRGDQETFRAIDGTLIPVEVTASPIQESGQTVAVITVFDDIRVRLAAEERLRLSDTAFRQAAEGVMITDAEKRIISVNPAFTEITGYEDHEVIGKNPSILSSDEQDDEFYADMSQQLSDNRIWQGEIVNRRKDGTLYTEWLSITPVYDQQDRLTNFVGIFHDISERKKNEDRLKFLAQHDQLTRLPNRELLKDRIEHAIARFERTDGKLAVLFIDLDRFKEINDSLGHDVGDLLICEAAKRIGLRLRKEDTLARQGGDEFVVLIEGIRSELDATAVADKIIEGMRPSFRLSEYQTYIGASIGVAFYPEHGRNANTLLRLADVAMYESKKQGGNSVTIYQDPISSVDKLSLISELHTAISENQLELYYQPKIHLASGECHSVEALLRWNHPERGLIGPGEFLPVAEEARMMVDIGDWVIRQATRQVAEWQERDVGIGICINVDGAQLTLKDFVDRIERLISENRIPFEMLGLEITETAVSAQPESVFSDLDYLRRRGMTLSIDDFGTGHSSLARLKNLPFDVLKIDASFVRHMVFDSHDRAIVNATIVLAHTLGLQVIAEGVETRQQLQVLKDMGCDAVQGYYYSRPLPVDRLLEYLHELRGGDC